MFIWSEKELIKEIIEILEIKKFVYIENFVVVLINPKLINSKPALDEANKENAKPKPSLNSKITSFFKVQPKKQLFQDSPNNISNENLNVNANEKTDMQTTEIVNEDYTHLNRADPKSLFDNQTSDFFYKSKKVLLMFRRVFFFFN